MSRTRHSVRPVEVIRAYLKMEPLEDLRIPDQTEAHHALDSLEEEYSKLVDSADEWRRETLRLDNLLDEYRTDLAATSGELQVIRQQRDRLEEQLEAVKQERDRAMDAAEGALATGDTAVVGWITSGDAATRLRAGLEELLSVAERIRGGDRSLNPEEWYAARDYARSVLSSSRKDEA